LAEVPQTKEKEAEKLVHGREASNSRSEGVCEEREGWTWAREGVEMTVSGMSCPTRQHRRRCRTATLSHIADTRATLCCRGLGSNQQPVGLQTVSLKAFVG